MDKMYFYELYTLFEWLDKIEGGIPPPASL